MGYIVCSSRICHLEIHTLVYVVTDVNFGASLYFTCGKKSFVYLSVKADNKKDFTSAISLLMSYISCFQVLGLIAFTSVWGVYMAFLASSGNIVANCMCPAIDDNSTLSILAETAGDKDDGLCDEGCIVHKELIFSKHTK